MSFLLNLLFLISILLRWNVHNGNSFVLSCFHSNEGKSLFAFFLFCNKLQKKCISEDIKILDNRWTAKMLTEFRAVLSNSRMSIYTRAAHIIYFLFVVHKKLVWMCVMGILNALWMTVVGLKAEFNVNWTVVVMKCLQNLKLYA